MTIHSAFTAMLASCILAMGQFAVAAPRVEGMSQAQARALMTKIAQRLEQDGRAPLTLEDIDFIGPAPVGRGLFIVSARGGSAIVMIDEEVRHVMLLSQYVILGDGQRQNALAHLRTSGTTPPRTGLPADAGIGAAPARSRDVADLDANHAIPVGTGSKVVHVLCDPNMDTCRKFSNDVLKKTRSVTAFIYPVSLADPGNLKDVGVRDLLCWPRGARWEQWDAVINGQASPAVMSGGCAQDAVVDQRSADVKQMGGKTPILVMPNGVSLVVPYITLPQFEKLMAR